MVGGMLLLLSELKPYWGSLCYRGWMMVSSCYHGAFVLFGKEQKIYKHILNKVSLDHNTFLKDEAQIWMEWLWGVCTSLGSMIKDSFIIWVRAAHENQELGVRVLENGSWRSERNIAVCRTERRKRRRLWAGKLRWKMMIVAVYLELWYMLITWCDL